MALKDVRKTGHYGGSLYRTLSRYLTSNVGKPWSEVYSHICSIADIKTHLGRELRYRITQDVDDNFRTTKRIGHNSWYVDDKGLLQAYPAYSWKQRLRERNNRLPIDEIHFKDDGPNIWYMLIDIPDGPMASKYTKLHKAWFRMTRTIEVKTRRLDQWEIDRLERRSIGIKKGKKDYYKEYTQETSAQTQCNHKLVALLWQIAAKKPIRKLLRLVDPGYQARQEKKRGMIAYVAGSSQEGKKHV